MRHTLIFWEPYTDCPKTRIYFSNSTELTCGQMISFLFQMMSDTLRFKFDRDLDYLSSKSFSYCKTESIEVNCVCIYHTELLIVCGASVLI